MDARSASRGPGATVTPARVSGSPQPGPGAVLPAGEPDTIELAAIPAPAGRLLSDSAAAEQTAARQTAAEQAVVKQAAAEQALALLLSLAVPVPERRA